jgi:hypothetical protein
MKLAAVGSLIVLLSAACPAHADGLQSAFGAVAGRLGAHSGGLAPFFTLCPKSNNDEWQFVSSALFVPISQMDSAVLVNTGQCNGGNGAGQYVVLNMLGTTRLVADPLIGDMSFIASNAYFFDSTLTLYGARWMPDDPHCCPSKKANLDINVKTGRHKLTVLDSN